MPIFVDCDFETASAADLKVVGASAYAQHPTTEILCLIYEYKGGMFRWVPGDDPSHLAKLAEDPGVIFVAHNAGFEQAIWQHIMVDVFRFPPIPVERWEDTMATCAWKAIPLKLEKAAKALRLPHEKDMAGNRLTLSMSRPDKKTGMLPSRDPETIKRVSDYCAQDVRVEAAVRHRIGLLSQQSPQERQVWLYDQKINQRGMRVDLDFVRQAELVIARATKPLLAEFKDITGGLAPGQVQAVRSWAGTQGVNLESLQKGYLAELLGADEDTSDAAAGITSNAAEDDEVHEDDRDLPPAVRRAIEIRQMLGSTSVKKLIRMRSCPGEDGRIRGLLQYHAAGTGRWGGRLLQPQNFPRGTALYRPDGVVAKIPELVEAIMSGDPEACGQYRRKDTAGNLVQVEAIEFVSYCLRYALAADPGKTFLVGDYAGIEARVVLALAGQFDRTQEMVEKGSGVYLTMAEKIYNIPEGQWSATKELIDKFKKDRIAEYTIGKNTVLGCGFQMGGETFHSRYCKDQPREFADRVVQAYRKDWAPKVPPLWYGLERAAMKAAAGTPTEDYGVRYQLEDGWLTARLPSRWQKLWYFDPKVSHDPKFDKPCWSYWTMTSGKWVNKKAYGGLLTENVVQGLARGLLCASIDRLERNGFPVVMSVHDELICEVDEDNADLKRFEALMAEPTRWAEDLRIPIAVEGWEGNRYRK